MFQVQRVTVEGETYYPVMANDKMLTPTQLQWLSETRVSRPTRKIQFIAADESLPKRNQPRLQPDQLHWSSPLRLVFQDTGLSIGVVEQMECLPPGATQWAEGYHLMAVARLHETVLAEVSWNALKGHLFGGVCVVVQGVEIVSVILGSVEGCCLPGALVLSYWQEGKVN